MAKSQMAGWGVAGFLGLLLLGQCGKDDGPSGVQRFAAMPAAAETPKASQWLYVQANTLNCREAGSTASRVGEKLAVNTFVGVLEQSGGWSRLNRDPECWVSSSYLAPDRKATPPARTVAQRSYGGASTSSMRRTYSSGSCPCSGPTNCYGPRGGRYCITSGGNKRYR